MLKLQKKKVERHVAYVTKNHIYIQELSFNHGDRFCFNLQIKEKKNWESRFFYVANQNLVCNIEEP